MPLGIAALIGGGLGLAGSIFGSSQQSSAANNATNAASQATAAQQQLTQQQLAIYQQLLQQYNQNVQPLQGPLGSEYGSLLNTLNPTGTTQNAVGADTNPDQATGIPLQGLTGNALQYLSNPQDTLSQQVGGTLLPGLEGGAAGNTALGTLTPGAISSLLSGGVTGNGTSPGVGSAALQYYLNQAQNGGINPLLQQNALGQQQQGFDQQTADLRNSLGGETNINAVLGNVNTQDEQQRASLIAQMTGQSQQLENQAMGSAFSTGQAIDTQTNQGTEAALQAAGGLDAQSLQYALSALQSAGGLDAQTLQMLTGAQQLGSSAQQTQLGNLGNANTTTQNWLTQLQNYLAQGQAGATGVASGVGGVAGTYGGAATAAAGNAASLSAGAAANNPFTGLGNMIAANPTTFSSLFNPSNPGVQAPAEVAGVFNQAAQNPGIQVSGGSPYG